MPHHLEDTLTLTLDKKEGAKMSKQVPWNKAIFERFAELAMLSEEEQDIMKTRIAGWSRNRQSYKFGMSLATLDRIIKRLKIKYDHAAKLDSRLPKRKRSVKETYAE